MIRKKFYEEAHAALFPFQLFIDQWAFMLKEKAGGNLESELAVFRQGIEYYSNPQEHTQLARNLLKRMTDTDFYEKVRDNTEELLRSTENYLLELDKTEAGRLSNSQLVAVFEEYFRRALELNSWGTLVTLMETGHESVLTDSCFEYLRKKALEVGEPQKAPEALSILCSPVKGTFLREKKIGLLKAALKANEKGHGNPEVQACIQDLFERYCWVSYGYTGPALTREQFSDEVDELEATGKAEVERELDVALHEDERVRMEQERLEEFFGMDGHGKRLFEMARTFMFQKELRKQVLYHSFYVLSPMREEAVRRAGIPMEQLDYALPWEWPDILAHRFDSRVLEERGRLCVYLPLEKRCAIGEEAKDIVESLSEASMQADIRELQGQPAFVAPAVRGTARLILNAHDLEKLKEGDILVSPATSPSMVSGMRKAAAIVTDQGGLTCHAAIVARELRKPCVIGTKIATKVFSDGDLLEVDATNGVVRKIPA